MSSSRTPLPLLFFIAALGALGQTWAPQIQSSPAPDFLAYQVLFNKVIWLENGVSQAGLGQNAGNASSGFISSEIPKAAGLTDAQYVALVAIARDYGQAYAAYVSARTPILKAVYAQQAAGGRATWAQAVQLSNLFKQYTSMVDSHIAQIAVNLGARGAQALANYVHSTVAPKTVWGH
jgi:hypothetical protein